MEFIKITTDKFTELAELQKAYKEEIGECAPTCEELESLKGAIGKEQIHFTGVFAITY